MYGYKAIIILPGKKTQFLTIYITKNNGNSWGSRGGKITQSPATAIEVFTDRKGKVMFLLACVCSQGENRVSLVPGPFPGVGYLRVGAGVR